MICKEASLAKEESGLENFSVASRQSGRTMFYSMLK